MTALQQINDIINHFTRSKCDDNKDENDEDPFKIYPDFYSKCDGKKNEKEEEEMDKNGSNFFSPELMKSLIKIMPTLRKKTYEERSDAYKAVEELWEIKSLCTKSNK